MKRTKLVFRLLCGFMLASVLWSCKTGVYASQYGKEDMAYISIMSSTYSGKTVEVVVDGTTTFHVKVVKMKQDAEKRTGDLYGIRTGKRHVIVKYKGTILYEKDIFVSSQQSKNIIL